MVTHKRNCRPGIWRTNYSLQTVSNYFLLSLALADLLIGLISMPLYTLYLLLNYWPLGQLMCDIWLAIDYLNSNAAVLNMLIISFDRYFSVTRPLTYRAKRTTKHACLMISCAWILSLTIWTPAIFTYPYYKGRTVQGTDKCEIEFVKANTYLTFVTAILAFYIPVAIMIYLYWRIWLETKKRYRDLTTLFLVSGVGGHVGPAAAARLKQERSQQQQLHQPSGALALPAQIITGPPGALHHNKRCAPNDKSATRQAAARVPDEATLDNATSERRSLSNHKLAAADVSPISSNQPHGAEPAPDQNSPAALAKQEPSKVNEPKHSVGQPPRQPQCRCPACPKNYTPANVSKSMASECKRIASRSSQQCAECAPLGAVSSCKLCSQQIDLKCSLPTLRTAADNSKCGTSNCGYCCCLYCSCPGVSPAAPGSAYPCCSSKLACRRCKSAALKQTKQHSMAVEFSSSNNKLDDDEHDASPARRSSSKLSILASGYQMLSENCASITKSSSKIHPGSGAELEQEQQERQQQHPIDQQSSQERPERLELSDDGANAKVLVDVATSPIDSRLVGLSMAGGLQLSPPAPFRDDKVSHEHEDFETRIVFSQSNDKAALTFESDDPHLARHLDKEIDGARSCPMGKANSTTKISQQNWHHPAHRHHPHQHHHSNQPGGAFCCVQIISSHDSSCKLCQPLRALEKHSGHKLAHNDQHSHTHHHGHHHGHHHHHHNQSHHHGHLQHGASKSCRKCLAQARPSIKHKVNQQNGSDLPILSVLHNVDERAQPTTTTNDEQPLQRTTGHLTNQSNENKRKKMSQKLTFSDILVDQSVPQITSGLNKTDVSRAGPRPATKLDSPTIVRSLGQLDDEYDYNSCDTSQTSTGRLARLMSGCRALVFGCDSSDQPNRARLLRFKLPKIYGNSDKDQADKSGQSRKQRRQHKQKRASFESSSARRAPRTSSSSSTSSSQQQISTLNHHGTQNPAGSTGSTHGYQHHHPIQPKSERKAAKTLSTLLLVFIVTWLPYNVLVLIKTLSGGEGPVPEKIWNFSYYLCYINSTINPLCYALCNAQFRRTYMRILKCKLTNDHSSSTRNRLLPLQSSSTWNKDLRLNSSSDYAGGHNGGSSSSSRRC